MSRLLIRFIVDVKISAKKQQQQKRRKTQKPKQSRPRSRPSRSAAPRSRPVIFNSPCGAQYFAACTTPFSDAALGACVPIAPARPTQKVTWRQRGTVSVGSGGYGFVGLCPTVVNDMPTVWFSNAAYNQSGVVITDPNVGFAVATGLPYPLAQFIPPTGGYLQAAVAGRLVSSAVRVRYVGTELNRGGSIYTYVNPMHSNINGTTFTTLLSNNETSSVSVSRNWIELPVSASEPAEQAFPTPNLITGTVMTSLSVSYPFSNNESIVNGSTQGGMPAIIFMTGVAGNQFEFEVIHHCEYQGLMCQGALSKTHANVEDANLVMATTTETLSTAASRGMGYAAASLKTLKDQVIENQDFLRATAKIAGAYYAPHGRMRGRARMIGGEF